MGGRWRARLGFWEWEGGRVRARACWRKTVERGEASRSAGARLGGGGGGGAVVVYA
uniref:AW257883 n=1 Tax=Arundo donax TaxID=35708 RepID=A0A0A8Z0T2_ARUDO